MKMITKLFVLALGVATLSACGTRTQIENGEVGKQITTSGLEDDIREPGAFRMESCVFSACPKLIRLSTAENMVELPGKYMITKSDLEMHLDVAIQYGVKRDKGSINSVFDRVKAEKVSSRELLIPEEKVYTIFIKPILKDTVREALNNYTINEIMDNLGQVRDFVESEVRQKLKESPIRVVNLSFSKVGYPNTILKAKEDFAKIELEKATKMKSMAAELEIMVKQLEIQKERARMALEVDRIVADHMDEDLKMYMLLDAINKSSENGTPWALTSDTILRQ